MHNHASVSYLARTEVLEKLCRLRGTSELNELERQAGEAIRVICGRNGIETADDLSSVLRYVAKNGYRAEDKPLIQEIINKNYCRGM